MTTAIMSGKIFLLTVCGVSAILVGAVAFLLATPQPKSVPQLATSQEQSTPRAGQNPYPSRSESQTAPAAPQRVALYEEDSNDPQGKRLSARRSGASRLSRPAQGWRRNWWCAPTLKFRIGG